jgi:hypothetical protein
MSKGSSSVPAAPNPNQLINQQSAANSDAIRTAAQFNQFGQVTPFGSQTWSGELGSPDRTVTTTLTPESQGLFDAQQAIAAQLMGMAPQIAGNIQTSPVSFDGLMALPGMNDFSGDAARVEQATFNRARGLLDPAFQEQTDRMQAQLEARGLPVGSEAYRGGLDPISKNYALALQQAADSSVAAGRAEQSRLFNQALTGRNQGINEMLTQRSLPINELAAILQGAPASPLPQFQATAQSPTLPINVNQAYGMGLNQGNVAAELAAQQNASAMGGLFDLGSALGAAWIMASDVRLKTDIEPVGALPSGLPLYRYRYKGDPRLQIGVMAHEAAEMFPDAVAVMPSGFLGVDYGRIA